MHFKIFGLSERLQCAISQENHINKNQAETKKSIEEKKSRKARKSFGIFFEGNKLQTAFVIEFPKQIAAIHWWI